MLYIYICICIYIYVYIIFIYIYICIHIYIYHHITGLHQGYEDHSYPSALEPGRRSISDFLHGSLDFWPWKLRLWAHVFGVLMVFSKLPSGKLSHNYGKSPLQISLSLSQGENNLIYKYLVGGWPTPLKNDGIRQLGWWHSQYDGKHKKKKKIQTTNQFLSVACGFSACVCVRVDIFRNG